jgi:hypothetical protein
LLVNALMPLIDNVMVVTGTVSGSATGITGG